MSRCARMRLLDLTLPTAAENLAVEEALLDAAEAGGGGETLRLWEPLTPFVVVGYANQTATEVNLPACEQRGIPVFRRWSGGGTVVQLPGGLNYSLILRITENGPTRDITSANQFIMDRNRAALQAALGRPLPEVVVRGHTDLAITSAGTAIRKVAGSAQRRRKQYLLFHGTLLLNCDLPLIGELLRMPTLQPDYRASRPHEEFIANLGLPPATVKAALARIWQATPARPADGEPLAPSLRQAIAKLTRDKYLTRAWNHKF